MADRATCHTPEALRDAVDDTSGMGIHHVRGGITPAMIAFNATW